MSGGRGSGGGRRRAEAAPEFLAFFRAALAQATGIPADRIGSEARSVEIGDARAVALLAYRDALPERSPALIAETIGIRRGNERPYLRDAAGRAKVRPRIARQAAALALALRDAPSPPAPRAPLKRRAAPARLGPAETVPAAPLPPLRPLSAIPPEEIDAEACRDLWAAKLMRAIEDAAGAVVIVNGSSGGASGARLEAEALAWIGGAEFRAIAAMIGADPDAATERARAYIRERAAEVAARRAIRRKAAQEAAAAARVAASVEKLAGGAR